MINSIQIVQPRCINNLPNPISKSHVNVGYEAVGIWSPYPLNRTDKVILRDCASDASLLPA